MIIALIAIAYAIGAVLAYGLLMGLNKSYEDCLGISKGDIAAAVLWGCLSWIGFIGGFFGNLITGERQRFCWQMHRSYPTKGDWYLESYIRQHGKI